MVPWEGLRLPPVLLQALGRHALRRQAHGLLGHAFFGVILLHLGVALLHAPVRRDGVFEAMAPWPGRAA